MAEEKQSKRNAREAQQTEEKQGEAGNMYTNPPNVVDAANTVTQPTSYKLSEGQKTLGGVPDNRFTEEVVKGSDEDSGSGWATHAEENQPVKGISEGDELPDTTGRAALREQKK